MRQLKRINTNTAIVISMVLGVAAGLIGGEAMGQIQFIGNIFFRLVQMGIVPFVMCAIVVAVGGLTARDLSGIGIKGIAWFASSSILASLCGIFAATVFQPGAGLADTELVQNAATPAESRRQPGKIPFLVFSAATLSPLCLLEQWCLASCLPSRSV